MAKKFTLPTELPKLEFGVLPDIHKYPGIKNIMLIVHWMHKHWGEGGGGGQQETVELNMRDSKYFGPQGIIREDGSEPRTSLDSPIFDDILAAYNAGKKVVLVDGNKWGPVKFEVENVIP